MSPQPVNQDVLVVGAGFAGAVVAERLASAGREVLVIDRRDHIAGNAYDHADSHGVLVHGFGPHLFHTNSNAVFEYLSRFTGWHPYEHRVLVSLDGRLYPLPINQDTINQLYNLNLDEAGVERFLAGVRETRDPVLTSEDVVLNAVGRELCDKIFRGYTRKQWSLDLAELSPSVLARIPTRTNRDDRYFTDTHQAMPVDGYTKLFERLLTHPRIRFETGVEFVSIRERVHPRLTVFTGCIDEYFGFRLGRLPYRSIRFEHEYLTGVERFQSVATVNYPNEYAFTRITEFKHITGQQHAGTSIVREFPTNEGEPYYPVPRPANQELYRRYQELAAREQSVVFLGRLAQYRYYNMDQAAAAALKLASEIAG
ncbi:MAG: UDP-galactopyranose mutase [Terracidiphilus sp.]|jgi:UDP-galactopyranose mutase